MDILHHPALDRLCDRHGLSAISQVLANRMPADRTPIIVADLSWLADHLPAIVAAARTATTARDLLADEVEALRDGLARIAVACDSPAVKHLPVLPSVAKIARESLHNT